MNLSTDDIIKTIQEKDRIIAVQAEEIAELKEMLTICTSKQTGRKLDIKQAAAYIGISRGGIYAAIHNGILAYEVVSASLSSKRPRYLIPVEALEDYRRCMDEAYKAKREDVCI